MLVSSTSLRMRLKSRPPLSSAASSSSRGALAQPPEEPELLLGDPELDLVVDRRHPLEEAGAERLPERDRVVLAGDGGEEALVELDALELDLAARGLCMTSSSGVVSIDSTLNGGITLARSGTCDLASTAPGRTAFENSPPSSCSSASHEAPQNPSLSSPVRRLVPPGQSAAGLTHRIEPADRVVAKPAVGGQRLDRLGPGLLLVAGAHATCVPQASETLMRSSRPCASSSAW